MAAAAVLLRTPPLISGGRRCCHYSSTARRALSASFSPSFLRKNTLFTSQQRLLSSAMRAARVSAFGPSSVIETVSDVPIPTPGDNQVLVRVKAAGVNPVDTYIRSGTYAVLPELPYTPGTEGAGLVEAVGSGVTTVKVGERVFFFGPVTGSAAEFALVDQGKVFSLPDRLSFVQGAGIGITYVTVYHALFSRGHAQQGESVLIHGATGGVGTAAIQIAKGHNLRVFGTAGSEEGLELLRQLGVTGIANHHDPNHFAELLAIEPRGFDVILENLANVNLDKDLEIIAPYGRVLVVGSRGRIEIDPRKTMAKEASIVGVKLSNAEQVELDHVRAVFDRMLNDGTIKPVIDTEYPLSRLAEAHEYVINKPASKGKLIINLETPDA